jgi:hypothetical protein
MSKTRQGPWYVKSSPPFGGPGGGLSAGDQLDIDTAGVIWVTPKSGAPRYPWGSSIALTRSTNMVSHSTEQWDVTDNGVTTHSGAELTGSQRGAKSSDLTTGSSWTAEEGSNPRQPGARPPRRHHSSLNR